MDLLTVEARSILFLKSNLASNLPLLSQIKHPAIFDKTPFSWDLKRQVKPKRWDYLGSWAVENERTTQADGVGNQVTVSADVWADDDQFQTDEDLDPWNYPANPVQNGNGHLYATDTPEIMLSEYNGASRVLVQFAFKTWAELNAQKCSDDYFWNTSVSLTRRMDDPTVGNNNWDISAGTIGADSIFPGTPPPDIMPERILLRVGVPVNVTLTASGIQGGYTISSQNLGPSASLPEGLSVANNVLTGTPTAEGTSRVRFRATADGSTNVLVAKFITIEVGPAP